MNLILQIIDEHEVVIRINKAPTVGFEKDVGSKTTHRFMYPESTLTQLPEGKKNLNLTQVAIY